MRIAFHQPNYLPNLGFFYKMAQVDRFIVTGNVQFVRREWHNRVKLPSNEKDMFLTVPVSGSNRQAIRDARIDNSGNWAQKHVRTLEMLYGNKIESQFLQTLLSFYDPPCEQLVDLNQRFIEFLAEQLGLKTELIFDNEVSGKKEKLLINICEKYGADHYVSGLGGKQYMDEDYVKKIREKGIEHSFVQKNVTGEFPYSSIHYVLTEGLDYARSIVHS